MRRRQRRQVATYATNVAGWAKGVVITTGEDAGGRHAHGDVPAVAYIGGEGGVPSRSLAETMALCSPPHGEGRVMPDRAHRLGAARRRSVRASTGTYTPGCEGEGERAEACREHVHLDDVRKGGDMHTCLTAMQVSGESGARACARRSRAGGGARHAMPMCAMVSNSLYEDEKPVWA